MIVTNRPELNACFARLIWANLLIQDETVAKMWLSNAKVFQEFLSEQRKLKRDGRVGNNCIIVLGVRWKCVKFSNFPAFWPLIFPV